MVKLTREEMAATQTMQEGLTTILSQGLPASLGKPDWRYHDLPRMSPELMATFKEIAGEENLHWITFADYGKSCRGQVLISPEGRARYAAYLEKQKEKETKEP